jgi:hypothetical protein
VVRDVNAFLIAACLLFAVDDATAITGNEWKQLPLASARQVYVLAVVDAFRFASVMLIRR